MTRRQPTPNDSIVLVADYQKGIADQPRTLSQIKMDAGVAALVKLAALRQVPVIVSTVPSQNGEVQLMDALETNLGDHRRFMRMECDSAQEPAIRAAIEESGRKKVLIAGVATEIAVSLPAYTLAESGYDVFIVVDACGGISDRTEQATCMSMTAAGINLTSIASVAGVFAGNFAEPEAAQAIGILYEAAQGV